MSDPTNDPFAAENADYATSEDAQVSWGTVWLAGVPIPVQGDVDEVDLARFEPKITIGDFTAESDPMFSQWIQRDWTGGGLVEDMNEGSDNERFRASTLLTRHPKLLTLQYKIDDYGPDAAASGDAVPVGDFNPGSERTFYAAFGTSLQAWDAIGGEFNASLGTTLTASPYGAMKGIVYDSTLFIPQGPNGYDSWTGSGAVAHEATIKAIAFAVWDNKLIALTTENDIRIYDGTSWAAADPRLKVMADHEVRNLVVWWTQDRVPALYIVTDQDVWAYDPVTPKLERTGLIFPIHPDQGRGAAAWRDDAMYVSVGMGVHQISLGGVISSSGLDRRAGLPPALRGVIVDLAPEYNGLLALVQGEATAGDTADVPVLEETLLKENSPILPRGAARSTLQHYTGVGWHEIWESDGAEGTPTKVTVSQAAGEYRIWWGYGGRMYTQKLKRAYYNAQQGAILGLDDFQPSGFLQTPRFNAAMDAYHKLMSHVEIWGVDGFQGRVEVSYRTDRFDEWRSLGTVTGTGRTILPVDPNGDGFAEGDAYHWLELLYQFYGVDGNTKTTPVVDRVIVHFVKVPLQRLSWVFTVPLYPHPSGQWTGLGYQEIADHIRALASAEEFFTFKHGTKTYRVRMAQEMGPTPTGADQPPRSRRINLIEVPIQTGAA